MSRIPDPTPEKLKSLSKVFAVSEKIMGFTPNDGKIMAHRPDILYALLGMVEAILIEGEVSSGLKRLIGILVSNAAGCQYCMAHAANGAYKQKEDIEKIKKVWEFQHNPIFSEEERAVLKVAWKAGMVPNAVTDADFDQLKKHFTSVQIVEIVSVISLYGFLNKWNSTFQTELEMTPKQFIEQHQIKLN